MIQIKVVESVSQTNKGYSVIIDGEPVKANPDFFSPGDKVFVLQKGMRIPISLSNIWVLHRDFGDRNEEEGYLTLRRRVAVKVDKVYPTPPYKSGSRDTMSLEPMKDDFTELLGIILPEQ